MRALLVTALPSALTLGLVACAALQAPIATSPPPAPASLGLRPLAIDAQGLALALVAPDVEQGHQLQIWQSVDRGDWTPLQTIPVTPDLVAPLHQGQVQWQAPLTARPARLAFQLRQITPDQARHCEGLHLAWPGWPDPPQLTALATATSPPTVALQWHPAQGFEAQLWRRDVLADGPFEALAHVDGAAGGHLIDDAVAAGDLLAYTVHLTDRVDGIPRHHPPSPAAYVAIAED